MARCGVQATFQSTYFLLHIQVEIGYEYHNWLETLQGWAKEWDLGCVNSQPTARGCQEAGYTQPRAHSFAQPCTFWI